MSFSSLGQPAIEPLIRRLAEAEEVTLLVGAGASMEAGLPGWPKLIESLLSTVAESRDALDTPELKRQWAQRTLERDDLLGAGAVVEVMAKEPLGDLISSRLYGPAGPAGYLPGPIAQQVANLQRCFGENLEILTTNYDDLIEQALIDAEVAPSRIRSYCTNRSRGKRAQRTVAVTHLHGLAGREGQPRAIVLTEEHYHRMQRGSSWQERLVTQRLEESSCLFVGTSMADPNLIRYLYGYEISSTRRHAAIFVRQAEPECPRAVREALEEAAAKRWERCGVEAIFVDHYADAAQLLYEVAHCKQVGDEYEPVVDRAKLAIECAEAGLGVSAGQGTFADRQVVLSSHLRDTLGALLELTLEDEMPEDERLGLGLWLFSSDGEGLTGWIHSDRAHQDASTIAPVPVAHASSWVAVRAVCQGVRVELDRDNYASRWRFVRGLPLVREEPARLPIGCLTIASTKPGAESVLTKMSEGRRAAFHEALVDVAADLIGLLVSIGENRAVEPHL